jgi:hypothetical protein
VISINKPREVDFMDVPLERRKYQRSIAQCAKTHISLDGNDWREVEVVDISAGGLCFKSQRKFEPQTKLMFNLWVYCMMSEFNLKLDGAVIRGEEHGNDIVYSVKFENVDKYTQVQLDEVIKSSVHVKKETYFPDLGDATYTFMAIPKFRTHRIRSYK